MDETTMTMGISPARAERGRRVYSAWKHLRNFDQQAVAPFEATSLAGKTCDLLGRMRQLAPYGPAALRPLLADAGITRLEFKNTLLPLLETLGIFQVSRRGGSVHSVQAQVLSQADVMDQAARCWETLDPEPTERGALELLRRTADLPLTREGAAALLVSNGLGEEEAGGQHPLWLCAHAQPPHRPAECRLLAGSGSSTYPSPCRSTRCPG
jgi:hypothetical protein